MKFLSPIPLRMTMLLGALLLNTSNAFAQNPIADLGGSTFNEKMVFAVYDIPSKDITADTIRNIAYSGIRTYARDAQVRNSLPPSQIPAYPEKMRISGLRADCNGDVFNIMAADMSMAKYGEFTAHRACLFPYEGGYRLNYFAVFGQQSGTGSANPNVLAAMLGRAMGNMVGLGDSSKFISKVLDRIEGGFKEQGIPFKLVQLHPANLEGRVAVADELPVPGAPGSPQVAAMASGNPSPAPTPPAAAKAAENPQLAARRDLKAIGLEYFNQDQFVDAIRRGDKLAIELFLAGGGIDPNRADKTGMMPMKAASTRTEIRALLTNSGAN